MNRGYSWLEIRAVDEEKRIIEGIATTPTVARDGDVLETAGIQFKLPIPFLWRHRDPFGNVVAASVDPDKGIKVRIEVGPAGVSAAIDEQWRMVKAQLVRGLSIGWRTLQELYDKELGGFRILKSEWVELSAVPVPSDPNATILSVRSADETILAALGETQGRSAGRSTTTAPGATGSHEKRGEKMKSFQTKISELEQRRSPVQERMKAIMEAREAEDRKFTVDEAREYDGLASDLSEIDADLRRYRAHQQAVSGAVAVPAEAAESATAAIKARSGVQVTKEERDKLPKGIGMARSVIALVRAKGNHMHAAELAREHYRDMPEVALYLRAAVEAGDTTTSHWASELVPAAQQMASEFIDLLRPATLIGRIPNLRRVPFNVKVPMQTGGGTYGWVGEARPKPVTKGQMDSATLRWAKCAGIIVITDELARFSSPSAEAIIRDEMIQGTAQFLDAQFVDSSVSEVANISPASITNGKNPLASHGTTADAFRFDLNRMLGKFIASSQKPSTAVLLMSETTAMAVSLLVNALGQREFPDVTIAGGSVSGLPIICSESVADRLILLNARDILFADEGGVNIDVSNQASVEMSSTPKHQDDSPTSDPVLRSLWQNNLVGLRVERYITWKRARTTAVEWIDNVVYTPTDPGSPA